ncbi:hypothetical protein OC834_007352, partial [Tilletia horrida]
SHVLIYQVVPFLASLIHIVRPRVIRIQSSKFASLFITGYIVDVEKVKDITWEDFQSPPDSTKSAGFTSSPSPMPFSSSPYTQARS